MTNTIPRRAYINKMLPAELAIRTAVDAIEEMGADILLTDAVILLQQAQSKVADYIDRELDAKETMDYGRRF